MSWFTKLFAGSAGEVVDKIAGAADRFITTGEERQAFKQKVLELVSARDSEVEATIGIELQAKERVLVAELQQGDSYTKRARPTVVYAGLAAMAVNNVLLPWLAFFSGRDVPGINLPTEFWVAWGGVVGTWVIGRTLERRGLQSKVVDSITGSKSFLR